MQPCLFVCLLPRKRSGRQKETPKGGGKKKKKSGGGAKFPVPPCQVLDAKKWKGKTEHSFPKRPTDVGGISGAEFTWGELIFTSLPKAAADFQMPICRVILLPSPSVGARGVQLGTGTLGVREVLAGGGDYFQLLHPSRSSGAFGMESCTTRAHGNRAGLFFPTKSLLDLLCACSARRNARIALSGLCC